MATMLCIHCNQDCHGDAKALRSQLAASEAAARRWYLADGTFVEMSPAEVVEKRKAAAAALRAAMLALNGVKWLGNNLHNIKADPDRFREFYEAMQEVATAALAQCAALGIGEKQ